MSLLPTTFISDVRTRLASQRIPLLIVLALTLLAKGGALLPGYAVDDYGASADGPGGLLVDVLEKGRVGHWLFLRIVMALQVEPNAAQIFFVSFSIAAYAFFGLAVARFWEVHGNGWLPVAAASIVANHPYTCEIFTFRVGVSLAAFVLALLSLLLFLASRPRRHLLLGAVVFALALLLYQIALHFALMIVLMGAAIALCRHLQNRPARRPLLENRNIRLLLFIVFGGILYVLAGVLFGRLIGIDNVYFGILPPSGILPRLAEATAYILKTFARPNVLVPPAIQVTFGLVVGCLMIGLIRVASRQPVRGSSFGLAVCIVLLLGCALLWSIGVFLFIEGWWPVPRSMAHVGIFWAGCLVLAALTMPLRSVTVGLSAAAVVTLISFVGVNEHILNEQHRLNRRDLLQADRIIARLEALPGFDAIRRVAFVGGRAWYPIGLQRTQWGDLNISAFGTPWSQVNLLREASGYNLLWSKDPQETAAAEAYCAGAEPWPAQGSVALRGDVAFICFAPAKGD